jgi:hypothetical protein
MYATNFPSGTTSREAVMEYLTYPMTQQYYVPILVFVDKKGMIRAQYIGDAEFLKDQDKNIRALAESLLKEPATITGKTAPHHATRKAVAASSVR